MIVKAAPGTGSITICYYCIVLYCIVILGVALVRSICLNFVIILVPGEINLNYWTTRVNNSQY